MGRLLGQTKQFSPLGYVAPLQFEENSGGGGGGGTSQAAPTPQPVIEWSPKEKCENKGGFYDILKQRCCTAENAWCFDEETLESIEENYDGVYTEEEKEEDKQQSIEYYQTEEGEKLHEEKFGSATDSSGSSSGQDAGSGDSGGSGGSGGGQDSDSKNSGGGTVDAEGQTLTTYWKNEIKPQLAKVDKKVWYGLAASTAFVFFIRRQG